MKTRLHATAIALAGVFAMATQAGAIFTCDSVVAKQGDSIDASAGGGTFGPRFADQVDCNDSPDALFLAQPLGGRDKLFRSPGAGTDEVVAMANGPSAPGCPDFRSSNVFRFWSLNGASEVAFRGSLVKDGAGVFKHPSGVGTALQACAVTGNDVDPGNPSQGVYTGFPDVAHINNGGKVALVADRDVAPQRCVFLCDSCSATCPPAACDRKVCVGDLTDDGFGGMNQICQIYRIGLGLTDALALSAAIGDVGTCANQRDAILFKPDLGLHALKIAVVGDTCPASPGGSFTAFDRDVPPLVNAGDEVGFQAKCNPSSSPSTTGLFFWEPPIETVAWRGNPAPLPGDGTIGNPRRFQFSDVEQMIFRATVAGNQDDPRARFCILRFDGSHEKVVCNDDPPPFGSRYVNIRDPGAAPNGDQVCARVRIKDDRTAPGYVPPLTKTAVIRCHPGCSVNADCSSGEYCAKAPGDCDGAGSCIHRPDVCSGVVDPACGCDDHTYTNAGCAAVAGVNVRHGGACS